MPGRIRMQAFLTLSFLAIFFTPAINTAAPLISIREFKLLMTGISEPEGYFDSDNFISNERAYLRIIPDMKKQNLRNGAYIGVGPDQNYSYIAAVRPQIAFIMDIRRQNALQHLYFKSLFQLSDTPANYLERLFGKQLTVSPRKMEMHKISNLLKWIDQAPANSRYGKEKEAEAIRIIRSWDAGLSEADFAAIHRIARAFMDNGPELKFTSFNRAPKYYYPSYRQLLEETDSEGIQTNYLADEQAFQFIKKLHNENRIIPIVGDLAGSRAMLKIGEELQRRGLTLTCLYVSNVELYLFGRENWNSYIDNLGRLPSAPNACLIRSYAKIGQAFQSRESEYYMGEILESIQTFLNDELAGKNKAYQDLITHGLAIR
jgi:hypothetical protein